MAVAVVGVGLEVEGDDMATLVVVANPDANPHLALQTFGEVGDLLLVVGLFLPLRVVATGADQPLGRESVVEVAHTEGGEEAHQLDGRPIEERRDEILPQVADAGLDALVFLAVAPEEEGQRVGVVVDAVKEIGAEVRVDFWDDEDRACAVVGIAVAALV